MTPYYFSTQLQLPIDEAIETLKSTLMNHHLGIVSDVNVAGIVKNKLDQDMPAYRILGACNPMMAKSMIDAVPQAGTLLPCTIVAREENGNTVFDFMDPVTVLSIADNETMYQVALQAREKLQSAIKDLES